MKMENVNELLFNDNARSKLKEGIDLVCDAVKVTMGPQGRNVIINKINSAPHITKDGVTVAKEIFLKDRYRMMGANLIKGIASKTCDDVGDGCQPLYSKIYTPNGFIKMGDIKIGDKICGTNNTIQEVIGVFPQGKRKIYKMKFDHQRETKCCEHHLWKVTNDRGKVEVLKTSELIDNFDKRKYYIPKTSVQFNTKELPIDPYLLGLLLGDGCLRKTGSIELSIGYKKDHIIDEIIVPDGIEFSVKDCKNKNYLRIKFRGFDSNGKSMKNYLDDLGLLDTTSETKFIPELYLYSDYDQRSALLSGLLNTDGYINKKGLFEISTISNRLNSDIITLSRSLGKSVNTRVKVRKEGNGSYSMTSINAINELKGYKNGIQLVEIEDTGEYEEVQCIKVSNPDHLYITDDYIVTHNTSTSTLFAQSIINGGYKKVKINHKNPVEIKSGLEKACKIIQEFIAKNAIKVASDNEMMKNVATISANNDLFLGEIIATAVAKVGEFGAVTVDRSNNSDTILDVVNGFRIAKRGYLSPYFITNESKQECVMEDVIIYLTDQRLTKASDAINILNVAAKEKCSVLIIAEDVTEDALSTFVVNKIQNGMNVCCIKAPDFGQTRKDSLSDIAVLTGGKVFNVVDEGIFGFAKKVIIKKEDTLIIGATGEENLIKEKASILKGISTQNLTEFEKKIIEERLSRFSNSVASLKVGAKTEIELLEKIDRIDDALCATRAAIEEGIVPGGGVVFLKARKELLKHKQMFKGDELDGFDIIMDTLQAPIKQILINAGIDYEEIIQQIEENRKLFYGYNAKTYKYGNLLNQGVIDPAKVLRVALQNAVSISSLFLTTECAIAPQYD